VVNALKAKLATQPNLMLNIPEILLAVNRRVEEANAVMMEAAVEPGAWDNNVWGLGITKIKIMLAKLERFAEMVATGNDGRTSAADTSDGDETSESGQEVEEDVEMASGWQQGSMQYPENWVCNTLWANDLFEGMDPSMWLDGTGDWGSMVTSGTGNP
jgi:hypothetical protein